MKLDGITLPEGSRAEAIRGLSAQGGQRRMSA